MLDGDLDGMRGCGEWRSARRRKTAATAARARTAANGSYLPIVASAGIAKKKRRAGARLGE